MVDDQPLDDMDRRILDLLATDGRASLQEVADQVGLRRPSVHARVKRLEAAGIIRSYHAALSPDAVEAGLVAYVLLTLDCGDNDCMTASTSAAEALRAVPQILEYHTIAGDHDALVKVRARDIRDLERISTRLVSGAPGVARIKTLVVLSTAFERPVRVAKVAAPRRNPGPKGARRRRSVDALHGSG